MARSVNYIHFSDLNEPVLSLTVHRCEKRAEDRHCQHGDDNNIQYNNDPVDGLYDVTCPQRVMGFFQTEVIEKYKPEGAKNNQPRRTYGNRCSDIFSSFP